jgi:hypothetical protein
MVSHTATPDIIAYQVALMRDAGLVEAAITDDSAGAPVGYQIFRITWTGHDFIDAMRSDTVWEKARHHVLKPAATWTFSVLLEWLREEAKRQLFGTGP